jgi:hypothetical protein
MEEEEDSLSFYSKRRNQSMLHKKEMEMILKDVQLFADQLELNKERELTIIEKNVAFCI